LSYDSTGFSLHVTTGVRGIDDRLGRVFALLTWGLPLLVILTVGMLYGAGALDGLTTWLGLGIGVLLTGLAVSAVSSARSINQAPPPGACPLPEPDGGTGRTMFVPSLGMLAQAIAAVPAIIPAVIALITGNPVWGIVTLMIGVLYGAGL